MSREDGIQLTEETIKEVLLLVWEVQTSPWSLLSHGSKPYVYASSVNMLETNTGTEGHCSERCR